MPSDAVIEGISGAIGGCVATIATYPLMTISTRQAVSVHKTPPRPAAGDVEAAAAAAPSGKAGPKPPLPPPPTPSALSSTIKQLAEATRSPEQWQSLFSGLSANLIGTTVSQGIYFYLYSLLRQVAVRRRSGAPGAAASRDPRAAEMTVAESLLAASLAGAGNVLLTMPIWTIATRMQTHQRRKQSAAPSGPNKPAKSSIKNSSKSSSSGGGSSVPLEPPAPGLKAVAREVFAEYGLGGFWHGVGAALVMVINPTIQYAFYEWLSGVRSRVVAQRTQRGLPPPRPSTLEVFLVSAVAKAGATVLTYPLLTIKTRMMTARKGDADMQYASVADAIMQIGRREGVLGYYQGIETKIVQSVLAAALLLMCKEKITDATRDLLAAKTTPSAK